MYITSQLQAVTGDIRNMLWPSDWSQLIKQIDNTITLNIIVLSTGICFICCQLQNIRYYEV